MQVTIGPDGLNKTFQEPFPETTTCKHCGGVARHAFTAHELRPKTTPYLCHMHHNMGKGRLWVHDACAVAVYLCVDCLKASALINQA